MKCLKHSTLDAVAICAYCGQALCPDCIHKTESPPRMVCSSDCAAALSRNERVLEVVLQQSLHSTRASAFYCYLCGGLSAAAAVVAWYMLPSPFLILFTAGCAVVLLLSGFFYGRAAKKQSM